ncbi:hypothetical protein FJZ17_00715 [Candidatus Pacearchaeota archaeon]|nr:hypothetical protein [Candidatus Pacearchaeota archaeon]
MVDKEGDLFEEKCNQQLVFDLAVIELERYFELRLSLSQKIELRDTWVPGAIADYAKTAFQSRRTHQKINAPEREAAARFLFNNYPLSLDAIVDTLETGVPLALTDAKAQEYLLCQQEQALLI